MASTYDLRSFFERKFLVKGEQVASMISSQQKNDLPFPPDGSILYFAAIAAPLLGPAVQVRLDIRKSLGRERIEGAERRLTFYRYRSRLIEEREKSDAEGYEGS